jgi:hypothetical protein
MLLLCCCFVVNIIVVAFVVAAADANYDNVVVGGGVFLLFIFSLICYCCNFQNIFYKKAPNFRAKSLNMVSNILFPLKFAHLV